MIKWLRNHPMVFYMTKLNESITLNALKFIWLLLSMSIIRHSGKNDDTMKMQLQIKGFGMLPPCKRRKYRFIS